jgi:lysophospholipase L1-like esterase
MLRLTCILIASLLWVAIGRAADEPRDPNLPTVVLMGDSIRLGYTRAVAKQLAGKANVVSPSANGGDSSNVLKNLEAWIIRAQPTVVHFNCGIHDTKKFKETGKFQVSPEAYEANLRAIVAQLRKQTKATVLFALTTPIVDDRAAQQRADKNYELLDASTVQYNAIARRVMQELAVPVNDLRTALGDSTEHARLINADGVHFTSEGSEKLAAAVAAFVTEHLPTTAKATRQ